METLPNLIGYLPASVQDKIGSIDRYVVDQIRGRAYSRGGKPICFTIPLWVCKKPLEYQIWYVAHEVAHIIDFMDRRRSFHDAVFHKILYEICPRNCVHFEIEYMKRAESRFEDFNLEDSI